MKLNLKANQNLRNSTLVLLAVIICDQVSKFYSLLYLKEQATRLALPGIVELRYSENTGIAFSIFNGNSQGLSILISLVLICLLIYMLKTSDFNIGYAFIFAGGLSNLIDRFVHGFVVDMINPLFVDFAIFNLADVALNLGVFLVILGVLRENAS